ncbi:MAG TPA: glycosyltransferase 87 family protein [Tessaracoccus flavescens]|uniref:Glycosyltransferase 87 family protein n=1 Tax=Tessaracoccus flavescens TaxID=399497 RepID=A0A921ENG9_9ACTN|nr:glycosyltransferase 87 family protein [Tessaracoccus flavescens]
MLAVIAFFSVFKVEHGAVRLPYRNDLDVYIGGQVCRPPRMPAMSTLRDLLRRAVELYLSSRVLRAVAVAFVLYLVVGLTWWFPGEDPWIRYAIDYDVYRLGGQALLNGDDLYGLLPDTRAGANLPFTYPPIAAVLFTVFAVIPFSTGKALLTLATCASMLGVIYLVLCELGATRRGAFWLMFPLGAFALQTLPMRETIDFGQVNAILMALVVIDLFAFRGRPWQGALVGLALAIKLTPAVFLAYFLIRRDWRALAVGIGSALLYTGIGFLITPRDSLTYWTHTLRDPERIGEPGFASNQALQGMLARAGVDSTLVWFLLCAVIGLACLALMWRLFRDGHDAMAATTMGLYALVASPVSWGHHWVWVVPALIVLTHWAWRWLPSWRAYLLAALVAVGAWIYWNGPHWMLNPPADDAPDWSTWEQVAGSAYLWWALAALAAAALLAPRRYASTHDQHE